MKNTTSIVKNHSSRALFALGLGGILLGAVTCAGEQPKNRCKVAPGLAIAKYHRKGDPSADCAKVLPLRAELVGMQAFVPNPTLPEAPDTPTSFAIKPAWLGERISSARDHATQDPMLAAMKDQLLNYPYGADAAPKPTDLKTTKRPYAFGKFKNVFPDDNGLCPSESTNESELIYPTIPLHKYPDPEDDKKVIEEPEQPETAVKYAWSKVQTIQLPSTPGTQTFADLTITRDGCSASYTVAILVPLVGCGVEKGGKTVAEPLACNPNPNETSLFGSGISQGVDTLCEDISSNPAKPEENDPASPNFVCVPTKMKP